MIKILLISMMSMSFLHAGWLGNLFDFTPTPYYTMPIDLSEAGNVAETDIKIDKKYRTGIALDFDFERQKNLMSDEKSAFLREKYFKQLRGGSYPIFPIKLTVIQLDGAKKIILIDKLYLTHSSSTSENRLIDELSLKEGKYSIKVETTENFPELSDLSVLVQIYYIRAPFAY